MSTPSPTPPATYPPAPAVAAQANVQPVNPLAAIRDHFLPSLPAVWKFFTTVYCEILQTILLAALMILATRDLFWRLVFLDVVVIMSAVGILFTGYRKLQRKNNATTGTTRTQDFPPLIKLTVTGKLLFYIVLVLALGIFKLVESFMNQTNIVTTVDFIGGTVIILITLLIDRYEDDNPTVGDWFFRRDYSWFVLELWSIGACVFVALLLLPLGTLRLPATPYVHVPERGVPVKHVPENAFDKIIGTTLALLLGYIVCEGVLLSSMHSFRLSPRPTGDYIGFRLAKQLRNILFLWAALWMILLMSVRLNPELERHFVGIYMRFSIDKFIAREVTSEIYSFKVDASSLPATEYGRSFEGIVEATYDQSLGFSIFTTP